MMVFDSFGELDEFTRGAVVNLLYRIGDDELIIGHSHSEWAGPAPIPGEHIDFLLIGRDEKEHARAYYEMLHELGEPEPDTPAFRRTPRQFRCASFVCLPDDGNWAFCVLRQFLYDAAETVRLTALSDSALRPLARLATKLRGEEELHLMHGRKWVLRLGRAGDDHHERMQSALNEAYPHALGLFEPSEADEPLAQAAICPREEELRRQWESAVAPVFADAGLEQPETAEAVYGGRFGKHPEALTTLLNTIQPESNVYPPANPSA